MIDLGDSCSEKRNVAAPARRGSPTVRPKQAAAAKEQHSSDSEDSYGAHQVEIAMDFGDIQI